MGRYKGRLISAVGPSTSNTKYTGSASGFWSLTEAVLYNANSLWPKALAIPDAPTITSAVGGMNAGTVSFNAPVDNGGLNVTSYTVVANPGNISASGASSPITVTGLTNGTSYTFTVTATTLMGTSVSSAASSSVLIGYGAAPPSYYTSGTAIASMTNSVSLPSFPAPDKSVIVIVCGTENPGRSISSISWGGLTFERQHAFAWGNDWIDIWWAYNKTGSTITTTGTVSLGGSFDDLALVYSVFTGCNQTNPWLNPNSPPYWAGGNASFSMSWSRPNVYPLVVCSAHTSPSPGYPTLSGSGMNLRYIGSAQNTGGSLYEYLVVAGGEGYGQSSMSGTITASNFASNVAMVYGDILIA